MAGPFKLKQNDTRPTYIVQLMENVGLPGEGPVNLTSASSVQFIMRLKSDSEDDPPQINEGAVIEDAATGVVSYEWQPADTAAVGEYNVEFEVTWSDGGVETIPNEGFNEISIAYDLGDTP